MTTVFDAKTYGHEILVKLRENRRLNDTAVMQLLYLLRDHQTPHAHDILIYDSIYVALASRQARAQAAIRETLHASESPYKLILLPIFDDAHWSLLFFLPTLRQYDHFDSYAPYHTRYTSELVALIDPDANYTSLSLSALAPKQQSNWECGVFLLMNAFLLIVAMPHAATIRDFITRHLAQVGDANRPRFTRLLIGMVERHIA